MEKGSRLENKLVKNRCRVPKRARKLQMKGGRLRTQSSPWRHTQVLSECRSMSEA